MLLMSFFYMVFSDEVIRMGFLGFLSLLHHKKPVLTKLFHCRK